MVTNQDIPRARIRSGGGHDPGTGPIRTCVGCRKRVTKRELLRVTVGSDADGEPAVVPDPQGSRTGRGAHVHPTAECFELAVRRKAFGRALRAGSAMPVAPLEEYFQHAQDDPT